MTLRAIIVDDEPLARERVKTLLREHADVEIVAECANAAEAIVAIHTRVPDVAFIDVQMPETTGLEMLRELDPTRLPLIVFITAYDEHALEAFRANAVQYLLKPVDRNEFRAAMLRVRQLAASRDRGVEGVRAPVAPAAARTPFLKRVVVKAQDRTVLLKMPAIDWFESCGNYVRVHSGNEHYLMRQTMATLEATLNPQEFVRIHRTAIVNLEAVTELVAGSHGEHIVKLRNGASLTLSRTYRSRIEPLIGKL
ncbi:MAG: LytR/AlgR family response regulator transcription factor [Thermoanaerobaculia bacterium]